MTSAPSPEFVLTLVDVELLRRQGDSSFRLQVDRLQIEQNVPVLIVGANGSGKSSLLDLLGLVVHPTRASQFLWAPEDAEVFDIAALVERGDDATLTELRGADIAYMPQTGGLVPFLSVKDNIALPAELSGKLDRELTERLCSALEISGVLLALRPQDLSIGQRQRVSLARAFAQRPRLLLADEPTAALDTMSAAVVVEMLFSVAPQFGITSIVATHDARLVERTEARRLELRASQAVEGVIESRVDAGA